MAKLESAGQDLLDEAYFSQEAQTKRMDEALQKITKSMDDRLSAIMGQFDDKLDELKNLGAEFPSFEEWEEDFNEEISMIAMQQNESPRRVRARLEKKGQMDSLRNQIIERKVLDLIREHAQFNDIPFELDDDGPSAVDFFVAGGDSQEIPEAKYDVGTDQLAGSPKK